MLKGNDLYDLSDLSNGRISSREEIVETSRGEINCHRAGDLSFWRWGEEEGEHRENEGGSRAFNGHLGRRNDYCQLDGYTEVRPRRDGGGRVEERNGGKRKENGRNDH